MELLVSLHRKPPQLTHLPALSEPSCCSSPPPQSPRPLSTLLPPTALHKYLHSSSGASEKPHTGAGGTLSILSRPRASEETAPLYPHGQEALSSPGQPRAAHHREARRKKLSRDRQTDSWRQACQKLPPAPGSGLYQILTRNNRYLCSPEGSTPLILARPALST